MSGTIQALLMASGGGGGVTPLVWSPTDKTAGYTLSEGGVRITNAPGGALQSCRSALALNTAGKRCFALEIISAGASTYFGFNDPTVDINAINVRYWLQQKNGAAFASGDFNNAYTGGALANGDKLVFAVDGTTRKQFVALNGVSWLGSGNPVTGANPSSTAGSTWDYVIVMQDASGSLDVRILSGATFPYELPIGYT